jgi:hypothetical protein
MSVPSAPLGQIPETTKRNIIYIITLKQPLKFGVGLGYGVFNATFKNISVISLVLNLLPG